MLKRIAPLSLLLCVALTLAGCAASKYSAPDESPVHGSVGVRWQSRDTSQIMPERAPF